MCTGLPGSKNHVSPVWQKGWAGTYARPSSPSLLASITDLQRDVNSLTASQHHRTCSVKSTPDGFQSAPDVFGGTPGPSLPVDQTAKTEKAGPTVNYLLDLLFPMSCCSLVGHPGGCRPQSRTNEPGSQICLVPQKRPR